MGAGEPPAAGVDPAAKPQIHLHVENPHICVGGRHGGWGDPQLTHGCSCNALQSAYFAPLLEGSSGGCRGVQEHMQHHVGARDPRWARSVEGELPGQLLACAGTLALLSGRERSSPHAVGMTGRDGAQGWDLCCSQVGEGSWHHDGVAAGQRKRADPKGVNGCATGAARCLQPFFSVGVVCGNVFAFASQQPGCLMLS